MAKTPRGRFVWYDLVTTDLDAAKEFYSDIVGWNTAPFEHAAGMDYTMWLKGATPDTAIGGLMELPEEARERGVPPHWMGYVAVDDVDATAARAEKLGGRTIMGPMDIPEVGRFVILADPQGAMISAYKSVQVTPVDDPELEAGDVSWHELATTDREAAFDFYSDLFGWVKTDAMDMGESGVYQMYGRAGKMLGGMYTKTAEQPGPPAWLYYISTADVDGAVARIETRGGPILTGPMDVPGGGRIVMALDPQGAAFALHQVGAM